MILRFVLVLSILFTTMFLPPRVASARTTFTGAVCIIVGVVALGAVLTGLMVLVFLHDWRSVIVGPAPSRAR